MLFTIKSFNFISRMEIDIEAANKKHMSLLVSLGFCKPCQVCSAVALRKFTADCERNWGREDGEKERVGGPFAHVCINGGNYQPCLRIHGLKVWSIHMQRPTSSSVLSWKAMLWTPDAWSSSRVAWSHGCTTVYPNCFCIQTHLKGFFWFLQS